MSKMRPTTLKILFIGNSFTARNDLPGLVAALAAADGQKVVHRLISVGGASLRTHWNKGEAQSEIQRGNYDRVILQEQSTLPIKKPARMRENVLLFDECIRDAGARTTLYMTWARRHAQQTQKAITSAYTSIAEEIGADVIPAGTAWKQFLGKHPRIVLHDRDDSHPTLAGSYLAACVAFAVLFDRSPVGLCVNVDGLLSQDAKVLQKAAALNTPHA